MQVTVSKARQPACNGVFTKQGICNDWDFYQHVGGARIFYDDAQRSWILTVLADTPEATYIRQSDDDDIIPPKGSGAATLIVDSVMSRPYLRHVYEKKSLILLCTCSSCPHAHVE